MESVLRGENPVEIDWNAPVFYYPVRHHSPACSWHLERAIDRYAPDCILIEGPENANALLPVLADEKTQPPVALYYSYRDDAGLLVCEKSSEDLTESVENNGVENDGAENDEPGNEGSENDESGNEEPGNDESRNNGIGKDESGNDETEPGEPGDNPESCRCYYPFLSNSPELVALRIAREKGIFAQFIDLPYAEILVATRAARGLRTNKEKQNYASDRYLAANAFQELLCKKAGVRSFEEFWETFFEVGGLQLSTDEFLHQVHTYCQLSRENTPRIEMEEDGCLAREAHMARRIAEARKQFSRVMVVTGGFHTLGIMNPEQEPPHPKIPDGAQQVYPMRYSMEAADALNGYASGMPAPGFYNHVWKLLHGKKPKQAYAQTVLDMLVSTGRQLRHGGSTISAFDEACAQQMAQGLAQLRSKPQPGLYELQDGVLSAFVKGETSLSGTEPLRVLRRMTTGNKTGKLCNESLVPPLVQDFEEQRKYFRLPQSTSRQMMVLNIFSSPHHRAMSRFFYRVSFLTGTYAVLKRGPNLLQRTDRNLIRETWECLWTANVHAELIDHSVSGATLEEACRTELQQRMASAVTANRGAALLVQGFLMGVPDTVDTLGSRLERLLLKEGDFASLCGACNSLNTLEELQTAYQEHGDYDYQRLLGLCFDKILQLLPGMATVQNNLLLTVQKACLLMYQLTERPAFASHRGPLLDALALLAGARPLHPAMHGTALGLLYGADATWEAQIGSACAGYLRGTHDQMLQSASFLQGLFYTARDLVLTGDTFVRQIDGLLCALSDEDYIQLLPELRLAFSYFTPMEQDRIARWAAGLHGRKSNASGIRRKSGIVVQDYAAGEELDAWAAARLDGDDSTVDDFSNEEVKTNDT